MEVALVLGGYEVLEPFASGGMATVHLGRHADGTVVAVKRLHAQYRQDDAFVTMLLDEARLASSVVHPNVVRVLDVVSTSDELALVMEYVHGLSLSRLLKCGEGTPPLDVAIAIVVDALGGLEAAHTAQGPKGNLHIVHRDVSPQNVIVDASGVTKLTDFGVAKAVGRLRSTSEGNIKGKLGYMSPEHAAGEAVDPRSDVYSAAIVLWELISGAPLFDAPTEGALFGKVLRGVTGRVRDVAPWTPDAVDAALARALARDPKRRFSSAAAFAAALSRAVTPATNDAVAAWAEPRARVELARRRLQPPPRPRARGWPRVAAAGVGFGGAVLVGAFALGRRPVVAVPPVVPVVSVAPEASVAAAAAMPSAAAAEVPAPKASARKPHAVPAPAPRRADTRCSPPYTIDADGITHFKPECMK